MNCQKTGANQALAIQPDQLCTAYFVLHELFSPLLNRKRFRVEIEKDDDCPSMIVRYYFPESE